MTKGFIWRVILRIGQFYKLLIIFLFFTQASFATGSVKIHENDSTALARNLKPTLVGVASNFTAPMKLIAANFESKTGFRIKLSFSSSGKLFAQIKNGAPFHLFLSADEAKPAALEQQGLIAPIGRITYAIGALALWSPLPNLIDEDLSILKQLKFNRLAIANPKIAPYGSAAVEVLRSLNLYDAVHPKIVRGENIAQAFQFVWMGSADLGFVSLSQVLVNGIPRNGSVWIVPETYHTPIRQDAVLLLAGEHHKAAVAFFNYLQEKETKKAIEYFGYTVP